MKKHWFLPLVLLIVMMAGCKDGSQSIPTTANPVITPDSGEFILGETEVTITCPTAGALIKYSIDEGLSWIVYHPGLKISSFLAKKRIIAFAQCSGMYDSAKVTTAVFSEKCSTPTVRSSADGSILTDGGVFIVGDAYTIQDTSGAQLYYTINDGAETPYTGPVIFDSTVTKLTVYSKKAGAADSTPGTLNLTSVSKVAAPKLKASGSYDLSEAIAITCATSGTVIHYTTDGSTPTKASLTYSAPFVKKDVASYTLKAVAFKDGMVDSAVSEATYAKAKIETPLISPDTDQVVKGKSVITATSTTTGSILYRYAWDGGTWTEGWNGASKIALAADSATLTVQAYAVEDGMLASDVASRTYIKAEKAKTPTFSKEDVTVFDFSEPVVIYYPGHDTDINLYYEFTDGKPTFPGAPVHDGASITLPDVDSCTLKACARYAGLDDSDIHSVTYTKATIGDVAINVGDAVVYGEKALSFSCGTSGVKFTYTLNEGPENVWDGEKIALTVNPTAIKVHASKAGMKDSALAVRTCNVKTPAPTISPDSGDLIPGETEITLSGTPSGVTFSYSLDDGVTWNDYISSFKPSVMPTGKRIKAKARYSGIQDSDVVSKTYQEKCGMPQSSIAEGGTFIPGVTKITLTKDGTTIHYSMDSGTTWNVYATPFTLDGGVTSLVFYASKSGAVDSEHKTVNVIKAGTVAAPKLKASGSYDLSEAIAITCATDGAEIHYTTDGSTPTKASILYSAPFVKKDVDSYTLKAAAFKDGMVDSAVSEAAYAKLRIQGPNIMPDADEIKQGTPIITFSCATAGSLAYWYAWDSGTYVKWDGSLLSYPDSSKSKTLSVYAAAVEGGMLQSAVVSKTYVNATIVKDPVFSVESSEMDLSKGVTITCATYGATIHYTTDGSDPTTSSTASSCTSGAHIDLPTTSDSCTLKAYATVAGLTSSGIHSATYTKATIGNVTIHPSSGSPIPVALYKSLIWFECPTEGVTFVYTLDGTTQTRKPEDGTFAIDATGELSVYASKVGMKDSATSKQKFVKAQVATPAFSPDGGGIVPNVTEITITCATEDAKIYYTTDGTNPTTSSTSCTSGTIITLPGAKTITAYATCSGMNVSATYAKEFLLSSSDANFTYVETGDNQWTMAKYKGTDSSVVVPMIYNGGIVVAVGDYAFEGQTGITQVTIPASARIIGEHAFQGCAKLQKVVLPDGLVKIGKYAFAECSSLESLTVPGSVTEIGDGLCMHARSLAKVILSGKMTNVPDRAFFGCANLISITIPSTVTTIGSHAFYGCVSLPTFDLPSSLTTIEDYAFHGCSGLTETFNIPTGVVVVDDGVFQGCTNLLGISFDGDVTSIGEMAFEGCAGLSRFIMPETVASVGAGAFSGCKGLERVRLSALITSIPAAMFSGCENLKDIGAIPSSVTSVGASAFSGCVSLTGTIAIPSGVVEISDSVFWGCERITEVTMSDAVSVIAAKAFMGCKALEKVVIPRKLKSIGVSAFEGCGNLSCAIIIPYGVVEIPGSAFAGCRKIPSVLLPQSVTSIANNAFQYCEGIDSIKIPQNVAVISKYAFQGCKDLVAVEFPDALTTIEEYAFNDCTSLASVTLPGNVTTIGKDAFRNCTGLSSLSIPASVSSIGDGAFASCVNVSNLTLMDHYAAMSVGTGSFSDFGTKNEVSVNFILSRQGQANGCGFPFDLTASNVTSVTIPEGTTGIAASGFSGYPHIASLTIPASVTKIGAYAFKGCTGVGSLLLPDYFASGAIGNGAFNNFGSSLVVTLMLTQDGRSNGCQVPDGLKTSGKMTSLVVPEGELMTASSFCASCTSLKSVSLPSTLETIGDSSFSGCTGLPGQLTIPSNVTYIGGNAYKGCTGLTGTLAIPSGVSEIGQYAFSGCYGLTGTLAIPSGVSKLGQYAFSGCYGFTGLTFATRENEGVTTLGQGAFSGCSNIAGDLDIPSTLAVLNDEVFKGCKSITRLSIPKTITSIGAQAFSGCTKLAALALEKGSLMKNIGKQAFQSCPIVSATLPNTVETIGDEAFAGCGSMKYVYCLDDSVMHLPASLNSLGTGAFSGCSVLINVDASLSPSLSEIPADAFKNCYALEKIVLPAATRTFGASAFFGCSSVSEITLPCDGPYLTVSDTAFTSMSYSADGLVVRLVMGTHTVCGIHQTLLKEVYGKMTKAYMPAGVTEISDNAFSYLSGTTYIGCPNLSVVSIDSASPTPTLSVIGEHAFDGCSSLKNFSFIGSYSTTSGLPSSLKTIGAYAFNRCTSFIGTSNGLTIPASVTALGEGAFKGTGIPYVTINAALSIKDYTFQGCTKLYRASLPSVTIIGVRAFDGCSLMNTVTARNLQEIGEYAFLGASMLNNENCGTLFTSESPLMKVGSNAFENCTSLMAVAWPVMATGSLGYRIFKGCTHLASATAPSAGGTVPEGVFEGCTKLASCTIPTGVSVLSAQIFKGCSQLSSFTYDIDSGNGTGIREMGAQLFAGCTSLTTLSPPMSQSAAIEISSTCFADSSLTKVTFVGLTKAYVTSLKASGSWDENHTGCTYDGDQ